MRETKFRAWAKSSKEMLEVSRITFDDVGMDHGKEGLAVHFKRITSWLGTNLGDGKGCDLMQFTGLKDKNGKEIYEGDIVQLHDAICVVEWLDCGFALRGDFQFNGNLKGYCDGCWGGPPEVIGNIYENPELLKEIVRRY